MLVSMASFPVKIENVVAVANLGVDIPLERISSAGGGSEYGPEQTSGVVYRTGEHGVAALVFSSGKIVCTGTKSVEKARETVGKVVDKIREIGVDVPAGPKIEIESIVASSKVDARLDLHEAASMLEDAEYNPDRLPVLVYRMTDPAVYMMIFDTGKIICSGARSVDEARRAMHKIGGVLKRAEAKAFTKGHVAG